jgi:hypothetical protein
VNASLKLYCLAIIFIGFVCFTATSVSRSAEVNGGKISPQLGAARHKSGNKLSGNSAIKLSANSLDSEDDRAPIHHPEADLLNQTVCISIRKSRLGAYFS